MTIRYKEAVLPAYMISTDISYERFLELMAYVDKIIGDALKYSKRMASWCGRRYRFGSVGRVL